MTNALNSARRHTQRVFHSTGKGSKSAEVSATTAAPSSSGGIMSFPKEHPFVFQLIVATGKTSAADIVCQTVAEKKKLSEIDWRRNGIFVVFGFAYLGCFQYYIMVNKYRQWFPTMDRFAKLGFAEKLKDTAGILDAGKMVLFDVIVHLPMMYFPSYYTIKEFVGGSSYNPIDWVKDGCNKYANNMKEDLTAMIKLWGPSDVYNLFCRFIFVCHSVIWLAFSGLLMSVSLVALLMWIQRN